MFDTSAFIGWWHEIYPVEIFEDIAKLITIDIETKIIQSPVEVRAELEEKSNDPLTLWVKKQSNLFIPTQPKLQNDISNIANQYPKLVKQHNKVNADPVVVALAQVFSAIVVTQENQKKKNNIVACCRGMNIECISLTQYIRKHQPELDDIRKELWGN